MRANLDPNAEGVEPKTDCPWGVGHTVAALKETL
jgi:hypothetical protein